MRTSEGRLRVIVACGAAGGIAATFNAPLTGMFFGFEIVLKEFSLDALAATILSAVTADVVSRAFFGAAPFFAGIPHDLSVTNDFTYLLIALLGITAGLIGVGFQKTLYKGEDVTDALWGERPAWLRPVAGGLLLGLLLLALPQLYGVGYPVMNRVFANHYVLWFVAIPCWWARSSPQASPCGSAARAGCSLPRCSSGLRRERPSESSSITCSGLLSGRRRSTAWSPWAGCSPPPLKHR
ncbi:MAG: chloride channel protein [Solirubrobacterales bacterium]|nr:chloride channel protein [Solirubrobacterales bacterium]